MDTRGIVRRPSSAPFSSVGSSRSVSTAFRCPPADSAADNHRISTEGDPGIDHPSWCLRCSPTSTWARLSDGAAWRRSPVCSAQFSSRFGAGSDVPLFCMEREEDTAPHGTPCWPPFGASWRSASRCAAGRLRAPEAVPSKAGGRSRVRESDRSWSPTRSTHRRSRSRWRRRSR